ncbi:MAG: hypothetical protein PHR38_06150 [Bacteroidales bacterium]|nr:hypothetical protein [Bacteroidales bacterium]MDD3907852.1 hypothetical protein [Bacteroidales bacterium]MDD4713304.1 hypothetical protein [Bacteroidales bacterium]
MDVVVTLFRFIYRIRYWIIIVPLLVTIPTYYFTSNLPTTYEASTTIFTGIASSPNVDEGSNSSQYANNAFDNIIFLVHSRSILEKVSIRLFAQAMMKGDPKQDNKYIRASNYNELFSLVPKDVKRLIDKKSEEITVKNLIKYKESGNNNFIYGLLNWFHPFYSISALGKIEARRLGSSDMIEIKYSCNDPGIVHQTLAILNEELISEYSKLQLGSSNDVISYFEKQLNLSRELLKLQEDSLMNYSMQGKIINYEEQTGMLIAMSNNIETKYEQAMLDFYSSRKLIDNLENRLTTRSELMKENKQFIKNLNIVSLLTKKITELETINDEDTDQSEKLPKYKQLLDISEQKLYDISNDLNATQYSKEGVSMNSFIQEWLSQVLINEKAKAEISILQERKKEIDVKYVHYTPIGPNLKRQEREITFTEESYHTLLNHLAQAKLQQKSLEMMYSKLNVVSPPVYPLADSGTNRKSIIIIAFFGSLIFIIGCFLILELFDKTIRDKYRATILSKANVLGAFPGNATLKFRSFAKERNRIATAYSCNMLMNYFTPNKTTIINLISKDSGEGKSFIADNMMAYWEELGFYVRFVSYHTDFSVESKAYFQAENIQDLVKYGKVNPDIVLFECPALVQHNIPKPLLKNANVNLYIIKATRAWQESDQLFYDQIRSQSEDKPSFLFLNQAKQFAVEDFTGLLPPFTKFRKRIYKLLKLELSSEKDQNIEQ